MIDPDGAAEDRHVFGLDDIDHCRRTLVFILVCDVDDEGYAADIERPACWKVIENEVLALYGVEVCAGWHDGAGLVAVISGSDFYPF